MSFAALKKRSGSKKSVQKMMDKIASSGAQQNSYIDDRYWKLDRDNSGNGYAIIRFLDSADADTLPFVKMYNHGFKGPGGWYIENSRTTIGEQDPVSEANSELWNSGLESDKDIARTRKRRLQYISNIHVVKDSSNPQNEGKTFLFKYGKSIHDMILASGSPEFEDDVPVNVFDLWNGANFKLKARKADGFIKYDRSGFEEPSQVLDDGELEGLYDSMYSLTDEVAEDKFKSYAELQTKFLKVTGGNASTSNYERANTSGYSAGKTVEETKLPSDDVVREVEVPLQNVEEDDTMSYFAKLAGNE